MAKLEKNNLTLEANGWIARWVNLNEGLSGDFNPDDPEDVNFMRFDVYVKGEHGQEVEPGFDSSFCTLMPAGIEPAFLVRGLLLIIEKLIEEDGKPEEERNYKTTMEKLSWMSPDWFVEDEYRLITLS